MKMLSLAVACSLHLFATMPAAAAESEARDVADASAAKLSEQAARKIAAEKFAESSFKSAELERENGRLVWSVEFRGSGSGAEQEVRVDATIGAIIAVDGADADSRGDDSVHDEHENINRDSAT